MLSALNFTSVNGMSIDFSVGETPPIEYLPVNFFDCTGGSMRGTPRPKMQFPGSWRYFQIPETMPIEIHGAILADDADDMVTKRKTLMRALKPFGPVLAPQNTVGSVTIELEGDPGTYTTDVGLEHVHAPVDSTKFSPLVVEFEITWVSFDPWFLDGVLDAVVL